MATESSDPDHVSHRMKLAEERIGYQFTNRDLLRQALTHSSSATSRLDSNERLEFLGDSVLGMIICRELYSRFPDRREGELTQQKSRLVSRTTCARVARDLGAQEIVIVGRGLQSIPDSIEAALVESLIAAVYLDGGLDVARQFILKSFRTELESCARGEPENFKSILQEETQRLSNVAPSYLLKDHRGPDHAREYCIAVHAEGQEFDSAWGRSKKEAEQRAAFNALQIINPQLLAGSPDPSISAASTSD